MVSSELPFPLDANKAGTGAVYSYDPVGSYEREACRAAGAAQSLLQPFLDNQVGLSSILNRGVT
jgi:20S proteasome alpha/beta subunit